MEETFWNYDEDGKVISEICEGLETVFTYEYYGEDEPDMKDNPEYSFDQQLGNYWRD